MDGEAENEMLGVPTSVRDLWALMQRATASGLTEVRAVRMVRTSEDSHELTIVEYEWRVLPRPTPADAVRVVLASDPAELPPDDLASLCDTFGELVLLLLGGYAVSITLTHLHGDERRFAQGDDDRWYELTSDDE